MEHKPFTIKRDGKIDYKMTYLPILKRKVVNVLMDEKLNEFIASGHWQWGKPSNPARNAMDAIKAKHAEHNCLVAHI